jgi:release factor glutamine methyltransferase
MSTRVPADPTSPEAILARLRAAGCVFAEDEARLLIESAEDPAALRAMVDRRVAGLPLEHVIGWAEFCGLRVRVDPGIFVPRRRTELLVRRAMGLVAPGASVVDLACGCGAIGAALAALVGPLDLHAVDIDPAAVRCARRNLAAAAGQVYAGDLYHPLPGRLRGRVDLVVANLPYVPTGAVGLLPPEARLHEPLLALDGGADGLEVVRRVAAGAPDWLVHGGHLVVEIGADQADAAVAAFTAAGLVAELASDEDLQATVLVGRNGPGRAGPARPRAARTGPRRD